MALNITINKVSVAASFAAGATVATAVASGGTTPYVYSLATGGDKFAINSSTGVVTTIAAMDITNIASFSVTATDSTTGTALTITSDVIYPPIQAAIRSKFNRTNVIYKITKDIDLGHGVLTIPEGCTLDFQGGSITNGTIIGNNTSIISGLRTIFTNISLTGTWANKGYVAWFGAKGDGVTDSTGAIQSCVNNFPTTVVSEGTYIVTNQITVTKSSTIIGVPNLYNKCEIWFKPSSDAINTLFLFKKDIGYLSIDGITIDGSAAVNVTNALWRVNTIGIDISEGVVIRLNNCFIKGFETGILSNNNTYYNSITNCRFDGLKFCLSKFHANNLIVSKTRFLRFSRAFSEITGAGVFSILENSFEYFTDFILYSPYTLYSVSLQNNYFETSDAPLPPLFIDNNNGKYGGSILFFGNIRNISAISNEFQVNEALRVYNIHSPRYFYSTSNKLVFSSNSHILTHYIYFDQQTGLDEDSKLKSFVLKDLGITSVATTIKYDGVYVPTVSVIGASNAEIEGADPITFTKVVPNNNFYPITMLSNSGYKESSRTPRVIITGNIINLIGTISRDTTVVSPSTIIGEIPDVNIGSRGSTNYSDIYIRALDNTYKDIILKYTYNNRQLEFVSGDNSKDIILDGSYILPQM